MHWRSFNLLHTNATRLISLFAVQCLGFIDWVSRTIILHSIGEWWLTPYSVWMVPLKMCKETDLAWELPQHLPCRTYLVDIDWTPLSNVSPGISAMNMLMLKRTLDVIWLPFNLQMSKLHPKLWTDLLILALLDSGRLSWIRIQFLCIYPFQNSRLPHTLLKWKGTIPMGNIDFIKSWPWKASPWSFTFSSVCWMTVTLTKLSNLFIHFWFSEWIVPCTPFLVRSQSSLQVLIRPHDTPLWKWSY